MRAAFSLLSLSAWLASIMLSVAFFQSCHIKNVFKSFRFQNKLISGSRLQFSSFSDPDYPFLRPKDVVIPMDKVEFSFARSSGPGGQNVNKLNTKAELRFKVETASWIKPEWRQRLMQYQSNKISKEGELIISSQEHR